MVKTKRNILLAIIIVLILVVIALLIGRFTYSYLAAQTSEDLKNEGETTASGDTIIFSKGNDLSISATTDNFNATSGNLTDTTNPSVRLVASSKTNEATATYYAGIKINKNTYTYSGSEAELILTVRDETGQILTTSADALDYVTVNGVSGFDITGKTGAFNIVKEHVISTNSSTTGTTHTWTFTLTFVNLDIDQSINENAELSMDVVLQKDEIKLSLAELCDKNFLTDCIIEWLYTEDGINDLYYHDGMGAYTNASEEAGDNSYRYSGADPNNYVCFGSDEEICPDNNLYRIIGLFDDDKDGKYKAKLIKADLANNELLGENGNYNTNVFVDTDLEYYKGKLKTINRYYWNDDTQSNNWNESELNTINLNENYMSSINYNWQNLIDYSNWIIGGNSIANIYEVSVKNAYNFEIITPIDATKYSDEIGLMYVSDYGYAASPENWQTILYEYDNDLNRNNNWLYLGILEWTITRITDYNDYVSGINSSGRVGYDYIGYSEAVRPVFYLKENVILNSGDGTISDPFRIILANDV